MTPSVLVLSHLFPSSATPGSGPFVADQVDALADEHQITVIAPARFVPPSPVRRWNVERAVPRREKRGQVDIFRPRVLALPMDGIEFESRFLPTQLRALVRRLARERDTRLLHAHFALPDGYAAAVLARSLRVRLLLTLWGSDILAYGRRRRLKPLIRTALTAATHVVAVSEEVAARAVDLGANGDRVLVAPGGVPNRVADAPSRVEARARLGLGPQERWIVWIGGLVPVKQPRDVVDAFARIADRIPDARLALVGDGPLRQQLIRDVEDRRLNSRVRCVGYVSRDDVFVWQAAADVVCNSSASEGMPLAILESLVVGTPVASYPVGGIPTVLARVGGGTIAEVSTPAALAAAIATELEAPRDRTTVARSARPLLLGEAIQPLRELYAEALGG